VLHGAFTVLHRAQRARSIASVKSSTSVAAANRRWRPLVHLGLLPTFTP
jgi:hypothetical protein